jgi:hypothetical protein
MSQVSAGVGSNSSHSEATEQSHDGLRRRYLLKRFFRTAAGFWSGADRSTAWLLSAALLLVSSLLLGSLRDECVAPRHVRCLAKPRAVSVGRLSLLYFAILAVSVLLSISGLCA